MTERNGNVVMLHTRRKPHEPELPGMITAYIAIALAVCVGTVIGVVLGIVMRTSP